MTRAFALIQLRRRWVIAAWALATIIFGVLAPTVSSRLHSNFKLNSPGYRANQALTAQFGGAGANPSTLVLTLPPGHSVTVAADARALTAAAGVVPANSGIRTLSYATTHSPTLIREGGRSTVMYFFPASPDVDTVADSVMTAASDAAKAAVPGTQTGVTGVEQLSAGSASGNGSVLTEVVIGSVLALVILAIVFGSIVALVPLLTAIVSILAMLQAVNLLTRIFTGVRFNPTIEAIIAILGLGLSLDYALLVVTRWREERARGAENSQAVLLACQRAGHAVAVSAVTASVGLLALAIVPVSFVRGVGLAGLFMPMIAALVALTLLPAILSGLGPRLDWPRRATVTKVSQRISRWEQWGAFVVRRRVPALIIGTLVLAALALPAIQINVGSPNLNALSSSGPAVTGYNQLRAAGFTDGTLTPIPVLIPPASDANHVTAKLASTKGVTGAFETGWTAPNGTTVAMAVPINQTGGPNSGSLITDVRAAAPNADSVGGNAIVRADNTSQIYSWMPLVLIVTSIITFLFLARTLRSIVLPLKAVALNLLSVAATYGVVVLVWQHGFGSQLLFGLKSNGAINGLAPILLFGFLFGLSMDYEVFLLTRMREAYDRTTSTSAAVIEGVGRTGRLITCAALILFATLISLSTAPDPTVKVIATGLAAGVVIDTVIVRSLIAPALVAVLGKANWWTPSPRPNHVRKSIAPTQS